MIIPQNTEPLDNIMNVIAGMSSYEKINVPENEVQLGGLTGDDYTVETATKYYNAAAAEKKAMELRQQATRDALTGIRNRHAYEAEIEKIEERIKEEGFSKFGIAMVDLNFLKKINDTYGHDRGNISIIKICMIVCKSFPHSPVFRIGGDEFVAIIENEDYEKINERISSFRETLEKIQADDSLEPWKKVSAAIGWSFFNPEKDDGVETVFKRADEKMYENKKNMKAERS